MRDVEFCGFEGEVFDAENSGDDDSCYVSPNKTIDREAKEDGSNLDDNAGKFGEAESYIVNSNMTETIDTHGDSMENTC